MPSEILEASNDISNVHRNGNKLHKNKFGHLSNIYVGVRKGKKVIGYSKDVHLYLWPCKNSYIYL